MLTFGFLLLVIQAVVTWYIMSTVLNIISEIHPVGMRILLLKMIANRPMTFVFNLAISQMLVWFTGAGLYAGFANLGSSILVGVIFPIYFNQKYNINTMEEEHQLNKERKIQERKASKLRKSQKTA